ncbi:NCK-interacting protein with SH3 domain-like isoform X2 [Acanthaster planci]|uniref:NCK-interacting protein with SH3 domain-like isoform X2 n=1 Tax=Acanthaster planci TaxID=133434 RepID=A0A8B7YTN5_ACAPL|nr:NCK-interacting protein with SH3 domain-like isoform X2 [Acanthaster planci]
MEVYEAKYDYVKERDDVLSFTKGEKFYITNKTNDKWWAAKKIDDNTIGYVPSIYLKPSTERIIRKLVPEVRRDTEEHKIHLRALAEIHKKIKPLPGRNRSVSCPAHVIGQAIGVELDSSDEEDQPKKLPPKKIQTPKTALRLEGLAQDKPPPPQHIRSHTHRGYPLGSPDTHSPVSPTLPTPPMSPNQLPPYKKYSWPHAGEPPMMSHHHHTPNYMSPPPMASPPPPDYDLEDGALDKNDMPFHHKLNSSGRYSSLSSEEDDSLLIKPKPLPNPVKESKEHRQMHRELRLSYKTGGPLPQKSELSVVNRERRMEQKRREQEEEAKSRRTSMEIKLLERKEKEQQEEEREQRLAKMKAQEAIEEEKKPEFMKVRLKQTSSLPKT